MVGVLLDLRTGDPILGSNGDYIQVNDNYAFYQIVDNLLNCQTGSEIWNIYYGFDLEQAIRLHSQGAPSQLVESLLADALSQEKEILIAQVDYLNVKRVGQELKVTISVQSRFGSIISLQETLGEGV